MKENNGLNNSGDYNSGNKNSGHYNSGNWNSGNCNSGPCNSGNRNSGNNNSGHWNSCDYETGYFNTENSKTIRIFNKYCDRKTWENTIKPDFLFFQLTFIENDKLKTLPYKEAFRKSFLEAKKRDDWDEQKQLLLNLPNFDFKIFEKISGITKEEILS
jgi:hypothetical protein